MFKCKKFLSTFTILMTVLVGGCYTYQTSAQTETKDNGRKVTRLSEKETYRMMELFGQVFEIARDNYVEEVGEKELLEAAMNGMLSSLDPHSNYLGKDQFKEMREDTKGEFGGLGITVTLDKDTKVVKVIAPLDDTPADKAGLQAGDLITHIDGAQIQGIPLDDAIKKMKGKPGTKVKLTIFRENQKPFDVTIRRAVIKIDSVKSDIKRDGKVGYIRITSFSDKAYKEMKKHLEKMNKKSKGKIEGYVLDLRNNPGGLLTQAIEVSDAFLNSGEIVSTRPRDPKNSTSHFATEGDLIDGKPLVVLINGGSASASEIVSGALQDHRRGVIVGTQSFGKGSVQTMMPISSETAVKLTTSRYYTPSGRSIQGTGITPDIEIKFAKVEEVDSDNKKYSESSLPGALKNDTKKDQKDNEKLSKEEKDQKDYQLQRAMDVLQGLTTYEKPKATEQKEEVKKTDQKK